MVTVPALRGERVLLVIDALPVPGETVYDTAPVDPPLLTVKGMLVPTIPDEGDVIVITGVNGLMVNPCTTCVAG